MILNATCPSLNRSHFELTTTPNDMNKIVVVHVYIEVDIQKYYSVPFCSGRQLPIEIHNENNCHNYKH